MSEALAKYNQAHPWKETSICLECGHSNCICSWCNACGFSHPGECFDDQGNSFAGPQPIPKPSANTI